MPSAQKAETKDTSPAWYLTLWKVPSVPAALAITLGFLIDIAYQPPLLFMMALSLGLLLAWLVCIVGKKLNLALMYLLLFIVCLGAFRHFIAARLVTSDDVRHSLDDSLSLCKFKGYLQEEPKLWVGETNNPLRTVPAANRSSAILYLLEMQQNGVWNPVKGNLRMVSNDTLAEFHLGDTVEITGRAKLISAPANPGEWDYRSFLNQQGIYGEIRINDSSAIRMVEEGSWFNFSSLLCFIRARAANLLVSNLPTPEGPLAEALLLGDSPLLHNSEWDKFKNTGVLHVLAISGQHLAILGGTLAWLLRAFRFKPASIAFMVTLFLLVYALLTGGRPSAMRAVIMVGCFSLGIILRRPAPAIHTLTASWIILAFVQPWDLFSPGCTLSFLATACLIWVIPKFSQPEESPLELLTHESKPLWRRILADFLKATRELFFISAIVWVFVTPLATAFTHVVSPVALLIGPPLIILTTIALLAGFIGIVLGSFISPIAVVATWIIFPCLWLCGKLVDLALLIPMGHFYLPDFPFWLIPLGYACVFIWLNWAYLLPKYAWYCVGILWTLLFIFPIRIPPRDLCVTFLAVGHGTCVVMETPDGKVLVYDAGSISGPEVSRRKIAPFLWSKKITTIDKLLISHADLDHFNGLPFLLQSFNVRSVATTPSFSQKPTPGVALVNQLLGNPRANLELITKGKSWSSGGVDFEVLHPPQVGPSGNENTRSMVIEVGYKGFKMLLTGDLQSPGLEMVMQLPPRAIDVLMAPHHGSTKSLPSEFLHWCQPASVVIGTQGDIYPSMPLPVNSSSNWMSTREEGAITLRFHRSGIAIETFMNSKREALPEGMLH
jgi:competence protein ComEC